MEPGVSTGRTDAALALMDELAVACFPSGVGRRLEMIQKAFGGLQLDLL